MEVGTDWPWMAILDKGKAMILLGTIKGVLMFSAAVLAGLAIAALLTPWLERKEREAAERWREGGDQ